jgi:hypothetical protein
MVTLCKPATGRMAVSAMEDVDRFYLYDSLIV